MIERRTCSDRAGGVRGRGPRRRERELFFPRKRFVRLCSESPRGKVARFAVLERRGVSLPVFDIPKTLTVKSDSDGAPVAQPVLSPVPLYTVSMDV